MDFKEIDTKVNWFWLLLEDVEFMDMYKIIQSICNEEWS